MRLILFEYIDEVKSFLNQYGKDILLGPDALIISLHPKVRSFLKEEGVESYDTISYFDNNAHHRAILKSEQVLNVFLKVFNYTDQFGVKKSYEEFFVLYMRSFVSYLYEVVEILQAANEKHDIKEIICCQQDDFKEMQRNSALLQDGERYLGFIVKEFCEKNNIAFRPVKWEKQNSNSMERILCRCVRFINQCLAVCDFKLGGSRSLRNSPLVVVPGLSYRMDNLLKEIKKRHPGTKCVMVWDSEGSLKKELGKLKIILTHFIDRVKGKVTILEKIITVDLLKGLFPQDRQEQKKLEAFFVKFEEILNSPREKDVFQYRGIDTALFIGLKLKYGIKAELKNLQHLITVLYHVLKDLNPKLLMAMYSRGIYCAMGELSHQLGFASLNISHGTHVPPNNEAEQIENFQLGRGVIINDYKYVAVQTPWANRFLDYYQDSRPRIMTGPLLYSRVNSSDREKLRYELAGNNSKAKIVVHASTQKMRHSMRFHIVETLDEYLSSLGDIISAINQLDDFYFVLRPHGGCNLSDEEFLKLLPKCEKLKIVKGGPFARVLSATDLLISYSSTCIEEAVQNDIPVICYDKWRRYNHFNLAETTDIGRLTKFPAYYITQPSLLQEGILKISNVFGAQKYDNGKLDVYKYPQNAYDNFLSFVDGSLEKSTV